MSSDEVNKELMLEMYLFEASQLIEQLEDIVIRCEKNQKFAKADIDEIFRSMHTIKGSSAMMMFNQIELLAHSLEDLFFFIRDHQKVKIDFINLFDVVLSGIDFIKGEINRIASDQIAEGCSEKLIVRVNKLLEEMKSSYERQDRVKDGDSESITMNTKYCIQVFFENDCQMENVRAYMLIHNLKDLASDIIHLPDNVSDNEDSAEIIKEKVFLFV